MGGIYMTWEAFDGEQAKACTDGEQAKANDDPAVCPGETSSGTHAWVSNEDHLKYEKCGYTRELQKCQEEINSLRKDAEKKDAEMMRLMECARERNIQIKNNFMEYHKLRNKWVKSCQEQKSASDELTRLQSEHKILCEKHTKLQARVHENDCKHQRLTEQLWYMNDQCQQMDDWWLRQLEDSKRNTRQAESELNASRQNEDTLKLYKDDWEGYQRQNEAHTLATARLRKCQRRLEAENDQLRKELKMKSAAGVSPEKPAGPMSEGKQCPICLEPPTHAFVPCGHRV